MIPKNCGDCKHGVTRDLSVDDLETFCYKLQKNEDWVNFPKRNDGTLRMRDCPLDSLNASNNNKLKGLSNLNE